MPVKKVGRLEYIEPNNLIFRDGNYVNKSGIHNVGDSGKNSNDSGSIGNKLNEDRVMPYNIEDLCISVDLYVMTSNRNSCGNPENDGDSVIAKFSGRGAASYMYGTDFNLPEQGAVGENSLTNNKHFMTTNFTDISLVNPNGNTNECVGIQSISVSYSNIFTPIVRITFVDVFGASIFSKEEKGMYDTMKANKWKIPTSAANMSGSNLLASLFSYPYPTFVLVLKGFFGDAVSYHLVCSGTDIKYNDSTGNYEIHADFAGSLYGALSDIPMSMLAVAPYIADAGMNYWKNETSENGRFLFTDNGNSKSSMLTFSELLFQNDNLSQNIRKNFSSHDEVKVYQKLITARKKIGELDFPMSRVNPGANMLLDTWYCRKTKSRYYYYYCSVDIDGITNGASYEMSHNIRKELETFSRGIKDINDEELGINIVEPVLMLDEDINAYDKSESSNTLILDALFSIEKDSNGVFNTINPTDYNEDVDKLRQIYPVLNHFLASEQLENGDIRYVNLSEAAREIFIYEIASPVDYREQLVLTKNNINGQIKERKHKIEDLKRDALVDLYGYKPTLENINGVVLAHLDTFMTTFYAMLNNIDAKKVSGERSLSKLGIKLSQTDLPNGYSDDAPLPPFTLFYAPMVNDNKITEDVKWPTDVSNRLSNLDEVKYVEDIVNASSLYENEVADFIRIGADSVNGANRYPGNIYEALENIKNPYSDIISKSNDKYFAEYVSAVFCLRLYYYLATNFEPNVETFAFIEAKNFTNVFDKKFSENVLNYLLEQVKQHGVKYYIDKLCGKNISSTDKVRLWDIGLTNTNHGMFTSNGAGELMYTWHKEIVDYTYDDSENVVIGVPKNEVYIMPIGLYNFTTIARDFIKKECYKSNRYITLSNSAFGTSTGKYYDAFNNKESFRLVSTPNTALGMFKDKKIVVSTSDEGKTVSLEKVFFDPLIKQYKDKTTYLPSDIFFSGKESDASKKTFESLCEQGSSELIPNVYNLSKNALKETYSSVRTNNGRTSSNIFLTAVYYNQNSITRTSDEYSITISEDDIKRSKAYLYLFSLVNNRFGMLQSVGYNFARNGFFSLTELLKEGAFYWRLKFMYLHDNVDPINLNGFPYKHAAANEIYSLDKEDMSIRTIAENRLTKCSGLVFIPLLTKLTYTKFGPEINNEDFEEYVRTGLNSSIARVENLMELFMRWAAGDNVFEESKCTFSDIQTYQELSRGGGWLTYEGFLGLNGVDIAELDGCLAATYKPTKGSKISVKNSLYIDNLEFFAPTDKIDKSKIDTFQEYVKMQNSTLSLLLDVYFVYDSSIFGQNKTSVFKDNNFINGFEKFISILSEYGYDKYDKEAIEHKNKFSAPDVKLSIYLTLKNIYERWCCSKNENYWKSGFQKEQNSSKRTCLSQYFAYMDTYYNEIGNQLIVNMDDVVNALKKFTPTYGGAEEISGSTNGTILSFMSHVAEKCGCTVYALPQDLTARRADSLVNMFKPIPYNKVDYTDDSSTFAIIYKSKYSEHLANDDGFEDDGYDLADTLGNINPILPESFSENLEFGGNNTKIASFGVTFGKGNQSYFTKIDFQSSKSSVAQSEYAMRALIDVASSANGAAKHAKSSGQDIYSQYANYSYQVTVTMLGCCQVVPLMYFQLNNVPMYHGAYIIQSVNHSIQNGLMITTFTGIRVSRYGLPLQPGNLLMLDSIDWGMEDENFSLEDDATVWDVSTMNDIVVPDVASKISYESVEFAKEKVKELNERALEMKKAKSPDKNTKPFKKLEKMTIEQKAALNAYFAAYNYNKEFILRNPMLETRENYENIHVIPDFLSDNKELLTPYEPPEYYEENKTGSNVASFDKLLRDVGYETVITVGTSLSGYSSDDRKAAEISVRLSQLRPSYGDILVYYASGVIDERIDDADRKYTKLEKMRIRGSDFRTVSQGVTIFYYGDKSNSKNKYAYGDKEYNVNNVFIYEEEYDPQNPNHPTLFSGLNNRNYIHVDCYKWDVKIYRRGMYPIGSSVKKKADENK